MRCRVRLDKESDVLEFVNAVRGVEGKVKITDGEHVVDGKSLLGMLYALTFGEIYCEADKDIYYMIRKFLY